MDDDTARDVNICCQALQLLEMPTWWTGGVGGLGEIGGIVGEGGLVEVPKFCRFEFAQKYLSVK